ncbi:MAG: phosphate acyltransferase PlsX [candidate division KSB1 bacterium]|nr:phosphate acyltransferase PlsX [candidate division KSB1 bacterium]MDZ7335538.1 phosphate acyltransferase PlsX [candidate division KSB1 bacterium]MDZ7356905.1 phosphate acyltransferase PlsX [candidate division KSB1 bacterium]MDZ7399264.1 phosphate acyltransferase PlsX [candidate division KSB1 bacterium]
MNRIIVDAMGGDNAPEEIIKGAALACRESQSLHCIVVGNQRQIRPLIEAQELESQSWSIIHASEVISMDDSPKEAVSEKEQASINVAARLLRDNHGDALVSAGNTGATILSCSKYIPRLPGIERAVLAAILPVAKNKKSDPGISILLDVGATLHCSVNQLLSFAIMGIQYARTVMDIENPRLGLLNIGEEATKGNETLIQTNQELRRNPQFNFIGNIEGKDIMTGIADVIVTEGMIGNIVLKCLEGMAELTVKTGKKMWKKSLLSRLGLTMLAPMLKKIKRRMDYTEYGGAPILGFEKLVVKAHGRSKAKAIKNAILFAEKSIENQLVKHIEAAMKEFYLQLFDHGQR